MKVRGYEGMRGGKCEGTNARTYIPSRLQTFTPPHVFTFLLFFVFLVVGRAQAQEVQVAVSADSVLIGERFRLTLSVEQDADAALFPDPSRGDTLLGDLEVISRLEDDDGTTEMSTHRASYEVATFALDSAFVPPLPVRLVQDQDTVLALSQSIVVPVRSTVPEEEASLRDLAPLASFPRPWWFWPLVAVGLLALLAALYYAWRRFASRGAAGGRGEPALPPREEAQRRLKHLEQTTDPADPVQVKPFYITLSNVLRRYLERRTGLPALEQTTRELMDDAERAAQQGRLPREGPERLQHLLRQSDLAKFAEARPPADTSRSLLEETRRLLDEIEEHLHRLEEEEAARREEQARREVEA